MRPLLFSLLCLASAAASCGRDYPAIVKEVYDGDTFTVDIDLGLGVVLTDQKIRLLGYDTPEVKGESRDRGLAVRDHVRELLLGRNITLRTDRDQKGKFGRWLAEIIFQHEDGPQDLGAYLHAAGMAVELSY